MWTHSYETRADAPREDVWSIVSDVARWPAFDAGIAWLRIDERPAVGARFRLKPRGGPALAFVIDEFEAPGRYADLCRMPLAAMRTRHLLAPDGEGTTIRVEIEIEGPLARFWGLIVGRRHAAGLPAQTARIVEAARARRAARG